MDGSVHLSANPGRSVRLDTRGPVELVISDGKLYVGPSDTHVVERLRLALGEDDELGEQMGALPLRRQRVRFLLEIEVEG